MANRKLIWMFAENKMNVNGGYYAKIIDLKTYQTLYNFNVNPANFEIFKKIMESDRYCLQYIQNREDELSEAAKIKLKISPKKPISYVGDPKFWQKADEFYLGS